MIALEQHITELLYRHNCVIIPGFGAFVGNYMPARVDERRGIVYPPSKDVIFNKNIVRNDGLLINKVQEEKNVMEPEARALVDEFITYIDVNLKEKGRLELPNLGILFYDQEKNIQFEQDRFSNLLLHSFGLSSVKFVNYKHAEKTKPEPSVTPKFQHSISEKEPFKKVEEKKTETEQPIKEEKKTASKPLVSEKEKVQEIAEQTPQKEISEHKEKRVAEDKVIQLSKKEKIQEVSDKKSSTENKDAEKQVRDNKRRFPWGRVAAALIVLPLAFYSYWIPFETDVFHTGYVSFQDFNPLKNKTQRVYDVREDQTEINVEITETFDLDEEISKIPKSVHYYSLEVNKNLYIPIDLDRDRTNKGSAPVSSHTNIKAAPLHLIVGCFAEYENAVDYVAELKQAGFTNALIVDKDKGLHRVSAGGFHSRPSIMEVRDQVISKGFNGWILRK